MRQLPYDAAEFQRLRDRVRTLEVQANERRRRLDVLERRTTELEELIDGMTQAEKITAAVAQGIRDERRHLLNLPRKIAGTFLALLIAVPAAHDLVAWLVG